MQLLDQISMNFNDDAAADAHNPPLYDPIPQISMNFNTNNPPFYTPPAIATNALLFGSPDQQLRLKLEQLWRQQQQLMQQLMQHSAILGATAAVAAQYYNCCYPFEYYSSYDAPLYYDIQERYEVKQQNLWKGMLSFLEVDRNSFLTPWNWKQQPVNNLEPRSSGNRSSFCIGSTEYVKIQPGSFFSHEVHDQVKQEQQSTDESSNQNDEIDDFLDYNDQAAADFFPFVNQNPTEDVFDIDDLH